LITIPLSRNALQSTASYYTLDLSPIATVKNTATQTSALRDLGFQLRGFLLADHFRYRLGEFSGERDSNGHDSLRSAGYVHTISSHLKRELHTRARRSGNRRFLPSMAGSTDKAPITPLPPIWLPRFQFTTATKLAHKSNSSATTAHKNFSASHVKMTIWQSDLFLRPVETTAIPKIRLGELLSSRQLRQGLEPVRRRRELLSPWTVPEVVQRMFPQNSLTKPSNDLSAQLQVFYF
jgi:hypothetical protein